jgi:hypothetical protein
MITPIPIKLPASFEKALGYERGQRWVAFYWEPCGDEAMYFDAYCSTQCNWYPFLQFIHHPRVKPWLTGYDFGSSDSDAIHWLLCDLQDRAVSVGTKVEVETFLIAKARENEPPVDPHAKPLVFEDAADLLKAFRQRMKEIPIPTMADIQAAMEQEHIATDKMIYDLSDLRNH